MTKEAKIRIEYYEPTVIGGNTRLIADKIRAILNNIDEPNREIEYKDSFVNFDAVEDAIHSRFVGSMRLLRKITPRKGELGTNKTSKIQLSANEGICEITHFVYDYSKNKLAVQYNYHGPKVLHLFTLINSLYSEKLAYHDAPRCSYIPIITGGKIELALESNDIRCIVAKPKNPVSDGSVSSDSDWRTLRNAYSLPDVATMSVEFKDRSGGLKKTLHTLLRNKFDIEQYEKLSVKLVNSESGKVNSYDLVENKLKESLTIPLLDDDTINADILTSSMLSAFDVMVEKYDW